MAEAFFVILYCFDILRQIIIVLERMLVKEFVYLKCISKFVNVIIAFRKTWFENTIIIFIIK